MLSSDVSPKKHVEGKSKKKNMFYRAFLDLGIALDGVYKVVCGNCVIPNDRGKFLPVLRFLLKKKWINHGS